jgi:hypothetical protein
VCQADLEQFRDRVLEFLILLDGMHLDATGQLIGQFEGRLHRRIFPSNDCYG